MATFDRPAAPAARIPPRSRAGHPFATPAAVPAPTVDPDRLRGIAGLVLLALVVFLAVALATFDPADPPAGQAFPPPVRPANACGLLGSTVATGLLAGFGHGAWWVVGLLAAFDLHLLRRRSLADLPLRTTGAIAATIGLCTLLALLLPAWIARPVWGPGGRVGATGRFFGEIWLAHTGAIIASLALAIGGIWLACETLLLATVRGARVVLTAVGSTLATGTALAGTLARRRPAQPFAPAGSTGTGRLASIAGSRSAAADAADDDESDTLDGPTIRVRRRPAATAPLPEPVDDDASFDEVLDNDLENDLDGDLGVADDGADDGNSAADDTAAVPPAAAPDRAAVPIRSLASRRKPVELLEMAADPVADYELPGLELLLPSEQMHLEEQEQEVRERARVLEKTFADFGFKVRVVEIETGPVISQYEIELEAGLRLAKISNLADDLAIALRVPSVRIVAPIPGKNSVGIEVPNTTRQMVRLREVIEETQAKSRSMKIPIYLGKDVAGNPMVMDMASMPHLLIAGRTGTGKSVCLNSIIVSMLMTRRPDEVRMLMIDPKMVELTPYKSLPHLMHPVVTDMKKAEAILAWAVQKMEERYTLLAKVGVRHLTQYNALGREELIKRINPPSQEEADAIPTSMPFIVMIADEIADMMMTAGKEIEQHIIRLAQKSRAVGIHLILATQKPTVDVITGLIKSNLPARIAFQVASRTDSRVVLDEMGAERLLGNGDMLFLSPGTSQILRGQGTYVSDDEIGRVMAEIGTDDPQYALELVNLQPAPSGDAPAATGSPQEKDDLYDAAVEVVIREGRGSVSLLQRALGVGYGRGARLIDFMAEDGVVGQYAGSQAREVLITMEQWADRKGVAAPPADPAPRKLKIQPHGEAPRGGATAAKPAHEQAAKPAHQQAAKPAYEQAAKPARTAASRPAPTLPLPEADEDEEEEEQDDEVESFGGDQAGGDTDEDAFEAEADGADADAFADAEGSDDEWEDDASADGSEADDADDDDDSGEAAADDD
jgi:S-DNA-T family DNA segregation ATPase FtsK/SpoIIIE